MTIATRSFLILIWAACPAVGALAADSDHDFFEKRIRPILVERCYQCHSLESGKDKGGLRVDSREALLLGGGTGPAVVPGDPEKSLLVQAIRRSDPDTAMPPKKGEALPAEAVKDFESWVRHGAVFPAALAAVKKSPLEHWAYKPFKAIQAPKVQNAAWPRNDIDRFLLARMEAQGVAPAADAAPEVLVRRISYVLTGLPPTPEEVQQFVQRHKRDAPAAIQTFVDSKLASPHFGERWARHWMDLVRYADGKGNEYDYEIQGAWRYRDYLVRAFNADVPYDQFVREHIAGDILPPRRDPQTGLNENVLATVWWNLGEAATSPVDLPNDEAERLDNQIEVLGKTFNAVTLSCARCHDHKFDPISMREYYGVFGMLAASPSVRSWSNDAKFEDCAGQLKPLRARALPKEGDVTVPASALNVDENSQKLLADFALGLPADWTLKGHAEIVRSEDAGRFGLAPGIWSGTLSKKLPAHIRSQSFTLQHNYIDVLAAGDDATIQVVVANYQMIRSPIYDGLRKHIRGGTANWKWHRIQVERWKGQRVHVEIFTGKVNDTQKILNTEDTAQAQFGVRAVLFNNGGLPARPAGGCELGLSAPEFDTATAAAIDEVEKVIPAPERILALGEVQGRDVPVYARGDANKPRTDTAPRKYLAACGSRVAAAKGSGRLELAEALLAPSNPLTARVAANRLWQHLFGVGLVPTADNFGILGEAPTHPELLDTLAARFSNEQHWSMKQFIREVVLSRAWQVASGPAPKADPDNKLLSRYPLRRMEGEAIRDAILSVSGTLDRSFGGAPIPVPHRLTEAGSGMAPPIGPIDGARRRSLYIANWRNYPNTFLDVFDKPPATTTHGRRDVSNVPTQALALLNDPFVTAQAKSWAERIRKSGLAPEARIERMYREAYSRAPNAEEVQRLLVLVGDTDKGWEDLALTLFNLKEFIYVR